MDSQQLEELRKKHYNASVVYLNKVHSDLLIMRVKPDFPKPAHVPGQYTTLGLGYWEPRCPGCQEEQIKPEDATRLVRRAYSIGCPILDGDRLVDMDKADWFEFYIVLVRESDKPQAPALTPRLFLLEQGSRLFMGERITGHYTLDPVQDGNTVLFLSTGTGEAPHNYMLWELLRRGHKGRILAACCVRYRRDLAYFDVHQQLMKRFPNYTYIALTTREADTIHNKVYIQDLITSGRLEEELGMPLDPKNTHVFLCGNPKMIGVMEKDPKTGERVYPKTLGVIEILEKRGFKADQGSKERGNIHFEEYW
ncbi:MAG: ferredoxin--NADP(+) reductase [Gemmatales bacterium]|nr:MAG: ferredoxin--NADP(+) reductase [Gemmatales bacterium]